MHTHHQGLSVKGFPMIVRLLLLCSAIVCASGFAEEATSAPSADELIATHFRVPVDAFNARNARLAARELQKNG
jgi:hypothetical protein